MMGGRYKVSGGKCVNLCHISHIVGKTSHSHPLLIRLARLAAVYGAVVAAMALGKMLFMAFNVNIYGVYGLGDWWAPLWNGLAMDLSMAGYLCAPVAFLALWPGNQKDTDHGWVRWGWRIWSWVIAAAVGASVVVDAVLYPYWGLKLDATPLFYFMTSPQAAVASISFMQVVTICLVIGLIVALLHKALSKIWKALTPRSNVHGIRQILSLAGMGVICLGLLFLAIRGGVTVGTMNLSRAYYTSDRRLCHAAVNPLFSFVFSLAHQSHPGQEFRYFSPQEAARRFAALNQADTSVVTPPRPQLHTSRPDIYIIILESFSAHLLPSLGGEPIAVGLDSIARQGLSFTQCYASSFRTDRALPAILSGYPAQPSTSLMRFTDKVERLASLPSLLKAQGYDLAYYYGGDASFTNMATYVRSMGFDRLTRDTDFPVTERLSKWGVHDDVLLRKASERWQQGAKAPMLTVIQTSSSHEPFEVPYQSGLSDERANAFAYTDHWVTQWINHLRQSGRWSRSLVVLVPDHYGCYPRDLQGALERHHIPLIIAGGALRDAPRQTDAVMAQSDLAGTLLGILGIDHTSLKWSKDVFDPATPQYAFFSEPEWAALLTPGGLQVVDFNTSAQGDTTAQEVKAYLQTLYDDLERL